MVHHLNHHDSCFDNHRDYDQAKRRSGSFATGGRDGDLVEEVEGEETVLKDNIMTDIKEGFIQRRLPDGGFKVQTLLKVKLKKVSSTINSISWLVYMVVRSRV